METGGYIVHEGQVLSVRVSQRGNLVDADGGHGQGPTGMVYCARQNEPWPTIYPTIEAAQSAQEELMAKCNHEWHVISHEERECSICGAVEFTPDY